MLRLSIMLLKSIKLVLCLLLTAATIILGAKIIIFSKSNQQCKANSAELNHIKYGLFSVNEWKKQLTVIVTSEISNLSLSDANASQLKTLVEAQLQALIDGVDKKIKESNKGTIKGWTKQKLINTLIDIKEIKKGIPEYADAIIAEMTKAKSENTLKDILKKRVGQFFDKTFEKQDMSKIKSILKLTDTKTIDDARNKIDQEIEKNKNKINDLSWAAITLCIFLFIISAIGKHKLMATQYFCLISVLLVLLLVGVMTPMIDMEAKISELSFVLLGYPIKFVNQVMYFQSKSIVDVFKVLIFHKELQMKLVGLMMVAFSIVFPVLKIFLSVPYYYNFGNTRQNKYIQFFVLKSGKWSMADVLVIAIFMAYIGFNSIITSQFGNFNSTNSDMQILTTNGTTLQPGFYIFMSYTILALALSEMLMRKMPIDSNHNSTSTNNGK
jgi:hypothetical protein